MVLNANADDIALLLQTAAYKKLNCVARYEYLALFEKWQSRTHPRSDQ
jgi:hypothetical protein